MGDTLTMSETLSGSMLRMISPAVSSGRRPRSSAAYSFWRFSKIVFDMSGVRLLKTSALSSTSMVSMTWAEITGSYSENFLM